MQLKKLEKRFIMEYTSGHDKSYKNYRQIHILKK